MTTVEVVGEVVGFGVGDAVVVGLGVVVGFGLAVGVLVGFGVVVGFGDAVAEVVGLGVGFGSGEAVGEVTTGTEPKKVKSSKTPVGVLSKDARTAVAGAVPPAGTLEAK